MSIKIRNKNVIIILIASTRMTKDIKKDNFSLNENNLVFCNQCSFGYFYVFIINIFFFFTFPDILRKNLL